MSTANQPDINELYGLFTQWASLLPKEGQKSSSMDMHSIENRIERLCGILENSPAPASLAEVKKEPEVDFKPTFIFQLTSDEVINPDKTQFSCVFDFCQELKSHCENNTTAKNLSIEKDWLKLLLACSSHNYERFMWIHLTFQSLNNLKLTWNQVQKRLQSKFDEPTRPLKLKNQIYAFQYIPEIETIEEAYKRFKRLADEVQYDTRENYVNALPEKIREVMRSTLAFDDSKKFYYSLDDIQQRAVVFINANSEDFIFFSKDAHVALNLNHEKVNKSDCEFHLLAEHSTLTCPDHIILRYPYMDFTCITVNNSPVIENTISIATPPQPKETGPVQKATTTTAASEPTRQDHQRPIIKQEENFITVANNKPVTETVTKTPVVNASKTATAVTTAVGQEKTNKEVSMVGASRLDRSKLPLNRGDKEPQNVKPSTSRQIPIVKATSSSGSRSEASPSTSKRSSSPKRRRSRSRSLSPRIRRRAHSRSISPRSRSRSPSSSSRPKREETPVEIGCYIHGLDANHTTKDCRHAQMVIPVRKSISPSPTPSLKSRRARNRSEPGEENICIFCGLVFKPGHLGYCKEVLPRKSLGRGRHK